MNLELSIIIVSYNTRDVLPGCLETIEKFLRKGCYEVIIVDNASSDGTVEAIRSKFDWVKLIESGENLGFGRGNNWGVKEAQGKYLWILNGDTLLLDDSAGELMKFLENNDSVCAVGPRLLLEDQKTEQEAQYGKFPTLGNLIFRSMNRVNENYTYCHPESSDEGSVRLSLRTGSIRSIRRGRFFGCGIRMTGKGEARNGREEVCGKSVEVDWVTGAALMIRRDLYEKIGGFDERFMLYFEDTDLCKQVSLAGYKVAWLPSAKLVHLGGKSLKAGWRRKQYYYKNQEIYFEKYYGKISVYLLKLLRWPVLVLNYSKFKGWRKS